MGQWGNDPGIAELAAVTYPVPNHVLEYKSNRSGQKPRPREEFSIVKQTGEPTQLMRVPGFPSRHQEHWRTRRPGHDGSR